jgi:hypothetical protein
MVSGESVCPRRLFVEGVLPPGAGDTRADTLPERLAKPLSR